VVDNDELYEYDASDELVAMNSTRFRWDRVGQLVEKDDPAQVNPTRYGWNAAHRLAKVTLPDLTAAEYRYNGDELRTWRREPSGAETNYHWVPSGILGLSQVLNETDGTGAPKANYVLGPNGLIAIVDGDGNERYYVFDALGSVLALTDETGMVTDTYAYDEYGHARSATGTSENSILFAGTRSDPEAALNQLINRSYSPHDGRFVSRDPLLGMSADLHAYVYALNSPVLYTDPDGLQATGCRNPAAHRDYCEHMYLLCIGSAGIGNIGCSQMCKALCQMTTLGVATPACNWICNKLCKSGSGVANSPRDCAKVKSDCLQRNISHCCDHGHDFSTGVHGGWI
jgi:RHS repeat-associated protein